LALSGLAPGVNFVGRSVREKRLRPKKTATTHVAASPTQIKCNKELIDLPKGSALRISRQIGLSRRSVRSD